MKRAKDVVRYEAEDLQLDGYGIESITTSGASAGRHISLRGRGKSGTASGVFAGEAGLYDVSVGFFDEDDGVGSARVEVAGEVQSFQFDRDLPGNWVSPQTRTSLVTHQQIELRPGVRFTLGGVRDRGEFARFDYIEFSPVEQTAPPAPKPVSISAPKVRSSSHADSNLGSNLASISDWSTQYPFRDFFKNARKWIPVRGTRWFEGESSKLDMDRDGWVKSLGGSAFDQVATLIPNAPKFDRYVVSYEGEGSLRFPNNPVIEDASRSGRMVISAPGTDSIDLRVVETDPNGTGDYLRNIQVIPEPFANLPGDRFFNPDFENSVKGFESLRFMDWQSTNFSEQKEWSNRAKPTDATFADGKGVPVEWMVELANRTSVDPWFNMPHRATDEYVRKFARYVKENLNSELDAYVEYSNEIWNGQFGQRGYVEQKGRQLSGIGDTPAWVAYHAQRSSEIGEIWDNEFGDQKERSIGVLGSQASDTRISQMALDFVKREGESLSEAGIDRLAVAPYFGGALGSGANNSTLAAWTKEADGGLNKVFQELNEGGLLAHSAVGGVMYHAGKEIERNVAIAKQAGVELLAYEGGQHILPYGGNERNPAIVDLFIKANQDPRMGELYQEYFKIWADKGGDLFANYSDISVPSRWGSFGAKDNLYQQSSPKWKALQDAISAGLRRSRNDVPERDRPEKRQKVLYGEIIDLTQVDVDEDGRVDERVELLFDSDRGSADGYFNTVGFYPVVSKQGGVLDSISGDVVLPDADNYASVALRQRVDAIELNKDVPVLKVDVEGGGLLAPFLIANGTVESLLAQNRENEQRRWGPNVYFSFVAANPDDFDHVRGSGNQLQFEDLWGGGDRNFADFMVDVSMANLG